MSAASTSAATHNVDLRAYLRDCRTLAIGEIERFVATHKHGSVKPALYDLVLDYPLREAKGLRPALCLATCRALGGTEAAAIPTAAVLELYHNAFLVHDDIEDGSERRRDSPTLHREHGVAVAINVGDAMLALALTPLLENTRVVGLGKSLRILENIATMARETAEGQAIELDWIRHPEWQITDDDYRLMVVKKTGWYSFIAPVTLGAIIGGASNEQIHTLQSFARELGIAFQIRDDLLNLESDEARYGKEICGDLWEGKRTLILLHMMRSISEADRREAARILALPRPMHRDASSMEGASVDAMLDELEADGHLTREGRLRMKLRLGTEHRAGVKTRTDVELLFHHIQRERSMAYADRIARDHAEQARRLLVSASDWLAPSVHRDLLHVLIDFTVGRET